MAYAKKTTHVDEGLSNLVDQFRDKPKLRALLGIYLRQVQDIENAFCGILESTELSLPEVVPPYEWSGVFDYRPVTSAELMEYTGTDGSVSLSLTPANHLWYFGNQAGARDDQGTLAAAVFDLAGVATINNLIEDPAYNQNATDTISEIQSNTGAFRSGVGPSSLLPSAMDGTMSFLIGGSHTPSSDNDGGDTTRGVWVNYDAPAANGFYLWYQNNGAGNGVGRQFILTLDWTAGAESVGSSLVFNYDEPLAYMALADFNEGKMRLIVAQGTNIAVDEAPITKSGTFEADASFSIGDPVTISGWSASRGLYGVAFSQEWASTIAAGIGQANMEQFLRYSEGTLSI